MVEPAVAAHRGVRVVVRGPPRGRALAIAARPDLQHELAPPFPRRGDRLRGTRGRRLRRSRREHHVLPRPPSLPADASWPEPIRLRAAPLLLLRALRVGPAGPAVRGAQPP